MGDGKQHFGLSSWVRPAVVGGITGVALVVIPTLSVASSMGGPTSKGRAPYVHVGLVYVVPIGLVAGVLVGLLWARRPSAESAAGAEGERA